MKEGKNLVELATEILRQADAKKDFVVGTNALEAIKPENGRARLALGEHGEFEINDHAHGQIAARLSIPRKYYDRIMSDYPELWSRSVKTIFDGEPERRLIRTLDGRVRAFLSDRYRRLDNEDLASVVLPILTEYEGLVIRSTEITERRLYISATYPNVNGEVKRGDVVEAGIQISNSEIGVGTYSVSPFIMRLVCLNGYKMKEFGINQTHVGRKIESEEDIEEYFSDETKKLDDATLISKTKDVVTALLSGNSFEAMINKFRIATLDQIPDVEKTIERVATNYQLNEDERKEVLRNIISEGNANRYGLANGISYVANLVEDYDRAMELQAFGGKIIDLEPSEWKQIVA